RFQVIDRSLFYRLGVVHRCSNVPERRVDGVHARVKRGRLVLTCNDKRLTTMLAKIFRYRVEPFFAARWLGRTVDRRPAAICCEVDDLCDKRTREEFHFRSAQRQPMIRSGPGNAWRRLDYIQTVHLRAAAVPFEELVQVAAARKLSRVADVSRATAQEIRVEREDDVGLLRTIDRINVAAKGKLRAFARAVANGGLPLMPF